METVCFAVARVCERRFGALRHVHAHGALPHRAAALLALLDNVIGHLANEQRHDGAVGRSPTGGNGLFRCCTSRNGAGALRHVHAHGALPHRAAALSPCWTTSSATWPANSDTMGLQEGRQRVDTVCFAVARVTNGAGRTATRARSRSFAPSCCCTLALLDNVIGHLASEQRHDGAAGRSPTGGHGLFRCCTSMRMALAHCDTCTLTELCPIVLLHSRPVGQRHRPLGQRTATRWGCRKVANGWKRSVSLSHKCEWRWRTATRARSRSFAPALPHRADALAPCWTTASATWPANSDTMGLQEGRQRVDTGLFRLSLK